MGGKGANQYSGTWSRSCGGGLGVGLAVGGGGWVDAAMGWLVEVTGCVGVACAGRIVGFDTGATNGASLRVGMLHAIATNTRRVNSQATWEYLGFNLFTLLRLLRIFLKYHPERIELFREQTGLLIFRERYI